MSGPQMSEGQIGLPSSDMSSAPGPLPMVLDEMGYMYGQMPYMMGIHGQMPYMMGPFIDNNGYPSATRAEIGGMPMYPQSLGYPPQPVQAGGVHPPPYVSGPHGVMEGIPPSVVPVSYSAPPPIPDASQYEGGNGSSNANSGVRRPRKKKGPKKPLSAYMFFCADQRQNMMRAYPQSSFAEIGRHFAESWHNQPAEQKEPYWRMNAKDKQRYNDDIQEMSVSDDSDSDSDNEEVPKEKKKRPRKEGPKRALSAYIFFTMEKRKEIKHQYPGSSFSEIAYMLGERWARMSAEEKQPYEAKCALDKARFFSEKEQMKTQNQQMQQGGGVGRLEEYNEFGGYPRFMPYGGGVSSTGNNMGSNSNNNGTGMSPLVGGMAHTGSMTGMPPSLSIPPPIVISNSNNHNNNNNNNRVGTANIMPPPNMNSMMAPPPNSNMMGGIPLPSSTMMGPPSSSSTSMMMGPPPPYGVLPQMIPYSQPPDTLQHLPRAPTMADILSSMTKASGGGVDSHSILNTGVSLPSSGFRSNNDDSLLDLASRRGPKADHLPLPPPPPQQQQPQVPQQGLQPPHTTS